METFIIYNYFPVLYYNKKKINFNDKKKKYNYFKGRRNNTQCLCVFNEGEMYKTFFLIIICITKYF